MCIYFEIYIYIYIYMQVLYSDLSAYVQLEPDQRSRNFVIPRGVRQGDPLPPVSFVNVLRTVLQPLSKKWECCRRGSIVGARADKLDRLTHLLFADGTTLIAKSKRALIQMIPDITTAFASAGLKLNAGKCKIQTNAPRSWMWMGYLSQQFRRTRAFKCLASD